MPKRRLLWHLFPSYALLSLAAVSITGWLAWIEFETAYLDGLRAELRAQASFLGGQLATGPPDDRGQFTSLCQAYAKASGVRVSLLLPDGQVAYDSDGHPEELESLVSRSEAGAALQGQPREAVRYNAGLDQRVLEMAFPVVRDGAIAGAIYLAAPLVALDDALGRLRFSLIVVALAAVALSAGAAWSASRGIGRPLDQLRQAAGSFAAGLWQSRVPVPDDQEFALVADAFNRMADSLQRQIAVLTQNNNEQKAVLASMAEGVLAVDSQERVISINPASGRLLGLDQAQVHGRRLQEVVRNADLSRFITRALACQQPIEADVLLHGDRERVMKARGSALHDLEGRAIGAVVVLNDVTDFRRLEHIRRDFVANVSHELKTPVTSIKGFVETLLDGAMNDPTDLERFLRIMAKQADRLHAIIEDLLSLSKIEEREDHADMVLEPGPLRPLLESAVTACQTVAGERQIEVKLDCAGDPQARFNSVLLEQAVGNLLDNAIKYSEPGRGVLVSTAQADGEVTISVTDHGSGIASQHLSRIFERFYRVDRARSRKMGGTGLGLAIVKHIVQAHRGHVTVTSSLGVGSTFTIHLPRV